MNRIRLLVTASILMFAFTSFAQQPAASDATVGADPTVDKQLTMLTDKLDLTSEQQAKTRTILQQLNVTTQKIMHDESMSRDERMSNVKVCHYQADKELRQILNDDQKKKLDQFEQEPHPDFHPNGNAATPSSSPQR